jgi:hypothetical protein
MKRFTAILAVLCIALASFSCGGGGNASAQSGTTKNTTESTKTESTTSKTEAPKPEFIHPAIEEINNSIEKALSSDRISASISSDFYVQDKQSYFAEKKEHRHLIFSEAKENEAENFIICSDMLAPGNKTVYFDGSDYYVSYLGVNAKIPQSGASDMLTPHKLISAAIPKFISDENVKDLDIEIFDSSTQYNYTVTQSEQEEMFKDFFASLEKAIREQTKKDFAFISKAFNVAIYVNADGSLDTYNITFDLTLAIDDAKEQAFVIRGTVTTAFSYAEESLEPPKDTESFVPISSEKEIPYLVLKNAAEKTAQSGILYSKDSIDLFVNELDGSQTSFSITTEKASDGTNIRERISARRSQGYYGFSETVIFAGGEYYQAKNKFSSSEIEFQSKTKYSKEDFEALYGGLEMYIPHIFDKNEIEFSHNIASGSSDEQIKYMLGFYVSEEEFLAAFGAQAVRVAETVADGREIWKYNVESCKVSVAINTEQKIEFYELSFKTEVYVIINGKKFVVKADVTDVFTISPDAEGTKIDIPQNAETYTPYTAEKQ